MSGDASSATRSARIDREGGAWGQKFGKTLKVSRLIQAHAHIHGASLNHRTQARCCHVICVLFCARSNVTCLQVSTWMNTLSEDSETRSWNFITFLLYRFDVKTRYTYWVLYNEATVFTRNNNIKKYCWFSQSYSDILNIYLTHSIKIFRSRLSLYGSRKLTESET